MQVDYTIECLPEDSPVRGNAMASDDPALDKEVEDDILAQLDRGNEWAWCVVKVTASVEIDGERFTGCAHLGGVSCANEHDFTVGNADYFADMKADALDGLMVTLEKARDRGQTAASIRKTLQEA